MSDSKDKKTNSGDQAPFLGKTPLWLKLAGLCLILYVCTFFVIRYIGANSISNLVNEPNNRVLAGTTALTANSGVSQENEKIHAPTANPSAANGDDQPPHSSLPAHKIAASTSASSVNKGALSSEDTGALRMAVKNAPVEQYALGDRSLSTKNCAVCQETEIKNAAKLFSEHKFSECEAQLIRAVKNKEKTLGPDNPGLIAYYNTLADYYMGRQSFGKAEPIIKNALRLEEKAPGDNKQDVANLVQQLGFVYLVEGKQAKEEKEQQRYYELSAEMMKRDLDFYSHKQSSPNQQTAGLLRQYSALLALLDRKEEAQKYDEEATQMLYKLSVAKNKAPEK